MSKTVDPKNMSKFDRRYLQDRGIDPDEYAARFVLVDEDEDELETADGQEAGRLNQDDEVEDVPYSEWTVAELQAEVDNRNATRTEGEDNYLAPATRKKADLITVLEADDELDRQLATDSDDDEA